MPENQAKCPSCGREIPADAAANLCPECLLRQGLAQSDPLGATGASAQATNPYPAPEPATLAAAFPQFEILKLLGQGGMGAVYQARQPALDRYVALKIIHPQIAHDVTFAERFAREARTLARLSHPHIVAVYDFGKVTLPAPVEGLSGEFYYLVLEYVDGATLRQLIRAGTLEAPAALRIVPQICDALQFAHDEGVVHRDIKPENIMLDRRGRVKIADFGLAKLLSKSGTADTLTGTHQVMGTPRYMAPEQMEGAHAVDHRADIYSLGVVFYEMLTGKLPLGRFEPPSQRVQLDVRLDEVVLRTLERDPERRYQQASQVRTDLDSIESAPPTSEAHVDVRSTPENMSGDDTGPKLQTAWRSWWAGRDVRFARVVQAVLMTLVGICLFLFLSFQYDSKPSDNPPSASVRIGFPSPWFTWELYPEPNTPFRGGFNLLSGAVLIALLGNAAYYVYWQIEKTKGLKPSRFSSPRDMAIGWLVIGATAIVCSMLMMASLGGRRAPPPATPTELLLQAASQGDVSQLRAMLDAGADVNDKNASGETALMSAAAMGHVSLVKSLTLLGADVNEQDQQGATALMRAASAGHSGVIHAFGELQSLADTARSSQGTDQVEAILGKLPGVDRRLVKDADLTSLEIDVRVDLTDKDGRTALMMAAVAGDAECLLELMSEQLDADPKLRDDHGKTALMLAAERDQVALLRRLLAEPNTQLGTSAGNYSYQEMLAPEAVDITDDAGNNAMYVAANKNHTQFAYLLKGEMERAVAHFDRALEKGGDHASVYYLNRGHALNVLGKRDLGAADLQTAEKLVEQ